MNETPEILDWPDNPAVASALAQTLEAAPPPRGDGPPGTLVLLSGGIDSVAVLAALLAGTDHRVHAHHVELVNRDNRQEAEADAVADVVDYCWRHYRDFGFSSSRNEFRITPRGYDLIVSMFAAGLVCLSESKPIDYVMTGHFMTSELRAHYGQRMLNSCFLRDDRAPRWLRPLDALPTRETAKIDIYRAVPPELAALSWSCRKPVAESGGYRPCGSCYACVNLDAARQGVVTGR